MKIRIAYQEGTGEFSITRCLRIERPIHTTPMAGAEKLINLSEDYAGYTALLDADQDLYLSYFDLHEQEHLIALRSKAQYKKALNEIHPARLTGFWAVRRTLVAHADKIVEAPKLIGIHVVDRMRPTECTAISHLSQVPLKEEKAYYATAI
jgi:hypothetical protein